MTADTQMLVGWGRKEVRVSNGPVVTGPRENYLENHGGMGKGAGALPPPRWHNKGESFRSIPPALLANARRMKIGDYLYVPRGLIVGYATRKNGRTYPVYEGSKAFISLRSLVKKLYGNDSPATRTVPVASGEMELRVYRTK